MYARLGTFGPIPLQLRALPAGDAGTFATVEAIRELVRDAQSNDAVRRLGEAIGTEGSIAQRALRLRDWIDRHFVFVSDPPTHEMLTTPAEQLRQIATYGAAFGDCDDAAVLAGALAHAAKLPVRIVLLGFGPPPVPFSHVFVEIPSPHGAVDMDVTRPAQVLTRPSRVLRVKGA